MTEACLTLVRSLPLAFLWCCSSLHASSASVRPAAASDGSLKKRDCERNKQLLSPREEVKPFNGSCLYDRCNCQAGKEASDELCANYHMYIFLYQHILTQSRRVSGPQHSEQ